MLVLTCRRPFSDGFRVNTDIPLCIASQVRILLTSLQTDLPRDKCRKVSYFLCNSVLGDNGWLNQIGAAINFDDRDIVSLFQRLSRRLATYNGYRNGWSAVPSHPAAFDDFVSWEVAPFVFRILNVRTTGDAGIYRSEFRMYWKKLGEDLLNLMDTLEELSLSFLGWPQRYSCLYCSSLALKDLGVMASGVELYEVDPCC